MIDPPAARSDTAYCLISPCRDEAAFCRRTLESVTRQTIPPARWIIVDDGSSDETPQIVEEYARRFPYIHLIRRENRGHRAVGPGVVDAFYAGYHSITPGVFPYICKLDLDLDLPPRYFETLIRRMQANPRLGTCSGKPYYAPSDNPEKQFDSRLVPELCGDEMSVGMTKFYRTACFEQIGGFVRQVMWDGIDCHRCRMLGWIACSFDEPAVRFIHLRPMGSSQKNVLVGRMRHGFGQYYMGTSLPYITASAMVRLRQPPRVLGSAAMWWGYVRAMLTRQPRYEDRAFRAFLRRYQWSCLLRGKHDATRDAHWRQAPQWTPAEAA